MKKSLHSPHQMVLQEMLKHVRVSAGLSQYDLASMIDRPQSFVSKYESGDRRLDIIELCTILNKIGVNPSHFIDDLNSRIKIIQ